MTFRYRLVAQEYSPKLGHCVLTFECLASRELLRIAAWYVVADHEFMSRLAITDQKIITDISRNEVAQHYSAKALHNTIR